MVEHPIRQMLERGLNVTVNSDDPPYFATTVGNEYAKAELVIWLSPDQLRRITKAAITASLAEPDIKASLFALPDIS